MNSVKVMVDALVEEVFKGLPPTRENKSWKEDAEYTIRVLAEDAYKEATLEKLCRDHLQRWGWKPQLVVLKDECEELSEASLLIQLSIWSLRFSNKVGKALRQEDFQHVDTILLEHLVEESWDLRFMLKQLEVLIDDPELYGEWFGTKVDQARDRIETGVLK